LEESITKLIQTFRKTYKFEVSISVM